eukprot:TRINITY_DN4021_c1_g1_i4.p7 TRINITY_DN4021_c1_g1~~TRINITY_DN4021_c1_g1_i4.p7  ORF type:complete len:111 (-),score=13.52 TRINITY_DN4021_c1_g1_i4:1074-1406(-)
MIKFADQNWTECCTQSVSYVVIAFLLEHPRGNIAWMFLAQTAPCTLFFDNCDYYPTMHNNICNAVFNHKKNEAAKQKTYAWLEQAMVQYNCASQPLWDVCYILEKGQNRI